jgi:hypothetical protein
MDHDSLYEVDICGWAEQQAAALRRLAARGNVPNDLDLMHVVEEIEDVGNSHVDAVSSYIRLILSHLLLVATDPDAAAVPHWRSEVATFHAELVQRYQPGMRQRLDADTIWRRALREAKAKFAAFQSDSSGRWPVVTGGCPFGIEELCDEEFDIAAATARVRDRLRSDRAGTD